MSSAPKLYGLILAAGASSRMGRDKALLPWPPSAPAGVASGTLLSAAIHALKPFTQTVIVVAGQNAASIAPIAAACGAALVLNPAPERGQFSSIQIGLRTALGCGCNAVMMTPVDAPPLSLASLERLRAEFDQALERGLWAVAPASNGRHGHPLLASRALIDAFLAAPATSNAREVRRAHAARIEYIPVSDPFVSIDVNTPQDYAALAEQASAQMP
jgi:molybdenum cofactor cytidylyltransferase